MMPLWLVVVIAAIVGAIVETLVLLRLDMPAATRAFIIAAGWSMPVILFVVFQMMVPEVGEIPIF